MALTTPTTDPISCEERQVLRAKMDRIRSILARYLLCRSAIEEVNMDERHRQAMEAMSDGSLELEAMSDICDALFGEVQFPA